MNTAEQQDRQAMVEELERLKAENAELQRKAAKGTQFNGLSIKVSQKGAISVYGLGRFPITLYVGQWLRLLDGCTGGFADQVREFIEENKDQLKMSKDG